MAQSFIGLYATIKAINNIAVILVLRPAPWENNVNKQMQFKLTAAYPRAVRLKLSLKFNPWSITRLHQLASTSRSLNTSYCPILAVIS